MAATCFQVATKTRLLSAQSRQDGSIDPRTELTRGMFEGFDGGGIDSENDGWRVESFCECRVVAFLDSIHFETRSRSRI